MMEAVLLTTSYSLTPLRQVLISTRFPSTGVTHALYDILAFMLFLDQRL